MLNFIEPSTIQSEMYLTLNVSGQLVVPINFAKELGWEEGYKVIIAEPENGKPEFYLGFTNDVANTHPGFKTKSRCSFTDFGLMDRIRKKLDLALYPDKKKKVKLGLSTTSVSHRGVLFYKFK